MLGIVIAYTLNPLVSWLEAIRIPRVLGTAIVMASVVAAVALGAYSLRGQVQSIIEELPQAAAKFGTGLGRMGGSPTGNLQKVQSAAAEVEKAAATLSSGNSYG